MAILVKTLPPPNFVFYCCNFAKKKFGASLGHSEHILLLVHKKKKFDLRLLPTAAKKPIDISDQGKLRLILNCVQHN
jgi:hypothetical protein